MIFNLKLQFLSYLKEYDDREKGIKFVCKKTGTLFIRLI